MDSLQLTSIFINKEYYKEYGFQENKEEINQLSQINIFIGANNSGKSRFLRKIFADESCEFRAKEIDVLYADKLIKDYTESFLNILKNGNYHFFNQIEIKEKFEKLNPLIYLKERIDHSSTINTLQNIINRFSEFGFNAGSKNIAFNLTMETLKKYNDIFDSPQNVSNHKFLRIYIPTLRGLRPIQSSGGDDTFTNLYDNYLKRTKFDYFKEKESQIYTGLNLYNDLQKFSHGDAKQRDQLTSFERFLSETFFDKKHVDLIPRYNENIVYVRIGNHEEPIYNLGDGIQSLIIMTYPLFFNQDSLLKIFIEEPETHLHPGFQRILIETLQRKEFNHFQYFITTHSNSFLDMTLDSSNISVYTFEQRNSSKQKPVFTITNVENSDTNILALIGVQNSSVFLSNCTIWVEGITDRIYIRKYLEILQKEKKKMFHENIHFSFLEYGGNNITHWSFLDSEDPNHSNILVERLCGKLFLITDKDSTGFEKDGTLPTKPTKKTLRLKQLQEKLGENRFYNLEVREIENLLIPNVLSEVIKEYENNTEIDFTNLKYENYKSKYIGRFINTNIQSLKRNYSSDSGTISNKVEFAKKSVQFIKTSQDMSEEAIQLAERIYLFIESMNK